MQIPVGMCHRANIQFRMELGDELCRLLVDEGVCPTLIRDIQADRRLPHLWRGMPRDMLALMHHIVGASRELAQSRRGKHHGDAQQRNASCDDHDHEVALDDRIVGSRHMFPV